MSKNRFYVREWEASEDEMREVREYIKQMKKFHFNKKDCRRAKAYLKRKGTSVPPTGYGTIVKANRIASKGKYGA